MCEETGKGSERQLAKAPRWDVSEEGIGHRLPKQDCPSQRHKQDRQREGGILCRIGMEPKAWALLALCVGEGLDH